MTLLLADGCDLYGNNADLQAAGWDYNEPSSVSVATDGGRFSKGSIKIKNTDYIYRPVVVNDDNIFIQFALKLDSLAHATDKVLLTILNNSGADTCATVSITSVGELKVRGATGSVVATSPVGVIKTGVWHYFGFFVKVSDASGIVNAEVDNVEVLYEESLDTKPGSATDVDCFKIHGASDDVSFGVTIDDIVVNDNSGTEVYFMLGDITIDTLLPNSDDATDTAWSSQPVQSVGDEHLNLDDPIPGSDDGDSTYNYSSITSSDSLYGFDDLPKTPQQIFAVQLSLSAKKSDGGSRTMAHLFKNDTKLAGVTFGPTTSYELHRSARGKTADSTPVAWTKSKVDSLLAGMRVVS